MTIRKAVPIMAAVAGDVAVSSRWSVRSYLQMQQEEPP